MKFKNKIVKINRIDEIKNWELAIKLALEPLLENNSIKKEYIDRVIEDCVKYNFHTAVLPTVAIPHSNSEYVNETGVSILIVEKGIEFGKNKIKTFIVFGAKNNDEHLELLSEIADFYENNLNFEDLF